MKPIIGISCARPEQGGMYLRDEYAHAISQAGGIPYLIPHLADQYIHDQLVALDGIIFSGGNDYDAGLFNQAMHPLSNAMDKQREHHDFQLFAASREQKLPILCICAGAQLAAIHFGASIIQDINDYRPYAHQHKRRFKEHAHVLEIQKGTMLRTMFKTVHPIVNSVHHQAIDDRTLPEGIRIAARSDDGIIEAFEIEPGSVNDNGAWFMAVQWHPEHLSSDSDQRNIFKHLVSAADQSHLSYVEKKVI